MTGGGSVDGKTTNIVSLLTGPDGEELNDPLTDVDETADNQNCAGGAAVATIKNNRSGTSVKAYLRDTNVEDNGISIYQGIAAVWDQEDSIEEHTGPCEAAQTDPVKWYPFGTVATEVGDDPDTLTDGVFIETDFDTVDDGTGTQVNDPTNDRQDGWTEASAAIIPARDGDTLTVTVKGVSGSITLIIDGDAPEIEDTVPASGGITKDNTVNLGFTVSDDGSGIRYDGESGGSTDDDLQPHNGDGDQRFDEPITNGDAHDGNGSTMDITVNYGATDDFMGTGDGDMSELGSNDWTQRSRGVEYALDMRIVGQEFGKYYWQVTAKDRVGNEAATDSDEDKSGDQPFSFNVDDADPIASFGPHRHRLQGRRGRVQEPLLDRAQLHQRRRERRRRGPHRRFHRRGVRLHGRRSRGHGRRCPERQAGLQGRRPGHYR